MKQESPGFSRGEQVNCQVCNAEIADDRTICPACHARITDDLAQVEWLDSELTNQICRLARHARGVGVVSHGAERPLPFDPRASEVADDLKGMLLAWARHAGCPGRWKLTQPLVITLTQHNWAADPEAGVFADELAWSLAQARHCIDSPPTDGVVLGRCCGQVRYARAGKREWTCPDCNGVIDVQARRAELLEQARARDLTPGQICQMLPTFNLPIDRALIRQWVHRGKLVSVGNDPEGNPLYLVGDVLDLVEQATRRPVLAEQGWAKLAEAIAR